MCKIYGYHRTSTLEQHLDRGIIEIKDFISKNNMILDEMFTDQQTGKNFNRPDYKTLKRMAKSGDTILITEVDRLGRTKEHTLKELRYFKDNNIRIMILELPTTLTNLSNVQKDNTDMSTMMIETINNMLIEMYASLAQAEMIKREKRQREGIEAMKARGEFDKYGRPKIEIDSKFENAYKQWKTGTIKAVEAMKLSQMTKPTFYRKVKEYELKNMIKIEKAKTIEEFEQIKVMEVQACLK